MAGGWWLVARGSWLASLVSRTQPQPPFYSAPAPETTSIISRVIAAWRTLFMYNVNCEIISPAFFVAVSSVALTNVWNVVSATCRCRLMISLWR